MPTPLIKKYAKKANISIEKAEAFWEKAKKIASEKFNKDESNYWSYVTGIFKKELGLFESLSFKDFLKMNLFEKLKPSEFRPLVKNWDKERYADIFKKYTDDQKAYRIYLPMSGNQKELKPPVEIENKIKSIGYEIVDYASGIATTLDGKRRIKIGKLLSDDPDLKKKFDNDPRRAGSKNEEYLVVISRHPYDLAGMSTDRGWTSCMNLIDGINHHYVPLDIKHGTIIAYLVKNDDKNINNPTARVLIKPFVNIENEKEIAFGIEDKVYGTNVNGFTGAVKKWVKEVNDSRKLNGIFKLNNRLYQDSAENILSIGKVDKLVKQVLKDPFTIKDIEDPPDKVQLAAVSQHGFAIQYIKNPSEKVQLAAVSQHGFAIQYIKNPSEKVQLAAVSQHEPVIQFIKDPSEAVQLAAIKQNEYTIQYIKKPTEKVQLAAVKQDGYSIKFIENPSEAVQLAAVKQHGYAIKFIEDPSEKVKLAAVKQDGWAIQYIKNSSEKVQLAAVEQNKRSIEFIKKPTKKVKELYKKLTNG